MGLERFYDIVGGGIRSLYTSLWGPPSSRAVRKQECEVVRSVSGRHMLRDRDDVYSGRCR